MSNKKSVGYRSSKITKNTPAVLFEDDRALTALFYLNINPYGTFELDLSTRLAIQEAGVIT